MVETPTTRDVHDFWNTQACGSHYVGAPRRTVKFYEEYRAFRYASEWHIPLIVPFKSAAGHTVLEIGCGNGADAVSFAQAGADYTGVDLTEEAVESTAEHLRLMNLPGRTLLADASNLPFENSAFDLVYSHGVLHHMPDPRLGFAEVYRVLKPGGRALVMLYHRSSFNYHIRIMAYMRLRLLLRILLRTGRWKRDRMTMEHGVVGLQGNSDRRIWDLHYRGFLRNGFGSLSRGQFVHHATDGPECPFAHVYTRREVGLLFSRFATLRFTVAHFPVRRFPLGRFVPIGIERLLARILGWYLFIDATKGVGEERDETEKG